ncbi:MAG: transcriptional repressor [Qingshengfaniella sp.]
MTAVGFETHDHGRCVTDVIATAESYCAANKVQFTPARRRVLEILLEGHKAMGAYDILDRLSSEGKGAQPPVAYRALDFLVQHGFAHKIERLNAYIACTRPCEAHTPAFLICRVCGGVAETSLSLSRGALGTAARAAGFQIERTAVEAVGICPRCTDADHAA